MFFKFLSSPTHTVRNKPYQVEVTHLSRPRTYLSKTIQQFKAHRTKTAKPIINQILLYVKKYFRMT